MQQKQVLNEKFTELEDAMAEAYSQIPVTTLKSFISRSISDAKKLLSNKKQLSVQELSYVLYKAYVTGVAYEKANQSSEFEKTISI